MKKIPIGEELFNQHGGLLIVNPSAVLLIALGATILNAEDSPPYLKAKRIINKLVIAAKKNGYKNAKFARKVFARRIYDDFSIKTAHDVRDALPLGEAVRVLITEGAPLEAVARAPDTVRFEMSKNC